jgi:4-alpha-glucanotransferase
MAVVRALGAPLDEPRDVEDALRERREQLARRVVEPVAPAWPGGSASIPLMLPAGRVPERIGCRLELEDGADRSWSLEVSSLRQIADRTAELPLPRGLPTGYHRLEVRLGDREGGALVISAPARAADTLAPASWGVFAPLYALHRARSWGVGDLSDLAALLGSIRELGGDLVGTLPLYAAFLRDPVEASPYAPVSRLFWNELFVDVDAVPEVRDDPEAVRQVRRRGFRRELEGLGSGELIDPAGTMRVKRQVLERATRALLDRPSARREAFEAFARQRPRLEDYARFRAAGERWGVDWRRWPGPPRDGRLDEAEVDPDAAAYHRYVQWVTEEQLERLSRSGPAGLYLDLPLGVHPDGYDAWRERDAFALGVSAGAPPDDLFALGQDWGFPPPHPERVREDGYRYQIECLRQAMRHAEAIRVDHVMGLHRLYWVPHGTRADRGVYVRHRPEEWYAILALESHRSGVTIVGEDLGTVPPVVRSTMRRRGLLRSHVLQMDVDPDRGPPLRDPPVGSLASLNTHDMPTFAAFWQGLDIDRRRALGLLTEGEAEEERRRRERIRGVLGEGLRARGHLSGGRSGNEEGDVLSACLAALASSPARAVMVNLEDLWSETRDQNVPGVVREANWRRRTAFELEAALGMPEVVDRLRLVGSLRRDAPAGRSERTARRP